MGTIEQEIQELIDRLSAEGRSRELSLTITKLEEALMWLEKHYFILNVKQIQKIEG